MSNIILDKSINHFFPPPRAAKETRETFALREQLDLNLGFGISEIDEYMVPMQPGDVTTLLMRPGVGKTTMCIQTARHNEQEPSLDTIGS